MATYQAPTSPVLTRLIAPLTDAYSGSQHQYECKSLGDPDFLESAVSRCISSAASGRRLDNLVSVNLNLARPMGSQLADPFAEIGELAGFDIYGGDGHFHEAACHDPHKAKKPAQPNKKANNTMGQTLYTYLAGRGSIFEPFWWHDEAHAEILARCHARPRAA